MSLSPTQKASGAPSRPAFAELLTSPAARLVEVVPERAGPEDRAAAFGLALAFTLAANPDGLLFWSSPDHVFLDTGKPHSEGLLQFGLKLDRFLLAHTQGQTNALWAAEQALRTPKACVFCTVAANAKPLGLAATRRLLLAAQKHDTRCILLRFDQAGSSAAWFRFAVSPAPSDAPGSELGLPAFHARLARNRAGPAGQSFRLEWNAHARVFHAAEIALAGPLSATPADGPAEPSIRRAG